MSFKELREALLLSYEENTISDEEFLLLYDEYSSKNPEFEYSNYEPFDLDKLGDAECKVNFRVEKRDLPALAEALQIPAWGVQDQTEKYCWRHGRAVYAS